MKMIRILTLIMATVALAGCVSVPTQQNASADHGPYPTNYEAIVHAYISKNFFDPDSVRDLEIQKPTKGWSTGAPILGEPSTYYGWEVIFSVNGKNQTGGYTGLQKYDLLVRDGVAIKVMNLSNPELTGGSINTPRM